MNIVLLGGSGFIGKAIKNELSKHDEALITSPSHKDVPLPNDTILRNFLMQHHTDILIYSVIDLSNRKEFLKINLGNIKSVIQCREQFNRFVLISSRAVYGGFGQYKDITEYPIKEIPYPISEYDILKYEEEKLCHTFLPAKKLLVLRIFDLYNDTIEHDTLLRFAYHSLKNNKATPNYILNPMHVSDAAYAITTLILHGYCGTFNICSQFKIGSKEVGEIIYQQQRKHIYIEDAPQEFTGKCKVPFCERFNYTSHLNELLCSK